MCIKRQSLYEFERKITEALHRSAQLAREDAIRHGTGIVVEMDGKIVEITADELKKQAKHEQPLARIPNP